jgi:hypothetical protein
MGVMNLRRKLSASPHSRGSERIQDVCPVCGHAAERGTGRLIDPVSRKEICVRCGNEVGREEQ